MAYFYVFNCERCGYGLKLIEGARLSTFHYIDYAKKAKSCATFEKFIHDKHNPYRTLNVSMREKKKIYELLHKQDSELVTCEDEEGMHLENPIGMAIYYSPRTKKIKNEMKLIVKYKEGDNICIYELKYKDKYRKDYVEIDLNNHPGALPSHRCDNCKYITKEAVAHHGGIID